MPGRRHGVGKDLAGHCRTPRPGVQRSRTGAPTSVCGNWRAELERFAPSLHVMVYGAGDRSTILETAGPRDVVIVSYTLLQQARAIVNSGV
ncbi:SNF2-related protein [Acidithiobacillus ferrivorans]|uniref:SNF2-related protein n=1 Tax=Acidithiobacillus ferrivorans TaxID=160808 RepID=UPI0034CEBC4E